jgi:hypothetical protein
MTSVVGIWNLALGNLSSTRTLIQAESELSTEAGLCRLHYAIARDTLLEGWDWRFARRIVTLAALVNDRPDTWAYCYQLPEGDLLTARHVTNEFDAVNDMDGGVPFDSAGSKIYTNLKDAFLRYTARVQDAAQFKPLFVDALATTLAARLAFPLTKDNGIQEKAERAAMRAIEKAKVSDGNQSFRHRERVPAHLQARSA